MKTYYHATVEDNLLPIIMEGIKLGCDGCVYLTETKEDAFKFVKIRQPDEVIIVFEFDLDESKVKESFDHSYNFFKCKAFYYEDIIEVDVNRIWKFD